jgi:predicted RecB family nuclease
MAELKSELSWSTSRARMLRTCPRRYYYHYYLSWEGWKPEAPHDRRQAYLLKSMVNLDMLAGQVVHDVIRETFNRDRDELTPVTCEQAKKLAVTRLTDAWRQSKGQMWRRSPKRFANLFEHYYEKEVTPERRDQIREKVEKCIANLFASEVFQSIRRAGVKCWLAIDQIDFFEFAGVKVYAAPDFALRDGQTVRIYDWKTGRRDDQVKEQLSCYALFAIDRWKVRPPLVIASAVYLMEGEVEPIEVTQETLARLEDSIRAGLSGMMQLLQSVEHNIPRDIDAFSRTQEAAQCLKCFFEEICKPHPN